MIALLAVVAAAVAPGDTRAERPWVLSAEVSWNGLAGTGVVLGRHLGDAVTLEGGFGASLSGAKLGLRVRYDLAPGAWTPFLGAGLLYAVGSGQPTRWFTSGEPPRYEYSVGPSPYLQGVAGLAFQGRSGFSFTAAAGYAGALRRNITYTGTPTDEDRDRVEAVYGSGPVVSLAFGYAF